MYKRQALDADTGTDLEIDFGQPQSTWLSLLLDLALKKTRVSLAIRFQPDSELFGLMVNQAFGKAFLDSLGDWRSPCIARLGDIWEHHFLVLPQTWCLSPGHLTDDKDATLSVIGTGRVVAVPPSVDPASRETWRWLHPPWQQPPAYPTPGLLHLLEECGYLARKSPTVEEDLPTWDDIFPLICHSNKLLQALVTPATKKELYYRNILYEALLAGFQDPKMLKGLLWHAPHGGVRQDPERRQKLSQWVAEVLPLLAAEALGTASRSPGWESDLAGLPGTASTPGTAAEIGPDWPLLKGSPGSAVPPPGPENPWNELNLLETLASELEQQADELERQQLSSTVDPVGKSSPCHQEKMVSTNLIPQQNGGEWKELRRAVRIAIVEFLLKNQDLLDSK